MNPRRILGALTVALLVSGLSTWMLSRKLTAQPAVQKVASKQYVAPSHELQADEVLTADNTELIDWPGDVPVEGAFMRPVQVIGREVLFPLAKGQPILDRDLSAAGSGAGLASKIPDGMRAVALRSDEIVGVAGFLLPGSHLDVLVTYTAGRSADPLTATVLENALVIAAGHQMEPDPSGKTLDATVVTLLLTPEQAQRAVLASTQGAVHFVLRNGDDTSQSAAAPVLLSQLAGHTTGAERLSPRRSIGRVAAAPRPREIETILANGAGDTRATGPLNGAGQ